jgi:60 kDa SS-A/Ro ribonucleoprotein
MGWHGSGNRGGQTNPSQTSWPIPHFSGPSPEPSLRKPTRFNEAGGRAYTLAPRQALAQFAATGCLNRTYYATAEDQLQQVLKLCEKVPTDFIARTALHCRQKGFMKDVPALLCAVLAARDAERCWS